MAVEDLKPSAGETTTDSGGKILNPSFINTHSHLDEFQKNIPTELSEGILKVWVNGKIEYENKKVTQQYSGNFLKRIVSK